jgi:hypothetical protein
VKIGPFEISSYKKEDQPDINLPFELVTRTDSYLYDQYNIDKYNPDKLYQKRGSYELFDQMREDDQISALLNLKKYIILSSGWEIQSEDDEVII